MDLHFLANPIVDITLVFSHPCLSFVNVQLDLHSTMHFDVALLHLHKGLINEVKRVNRLKDPA